MMLEFDQLVSKYNLAPKGVFHIGASTGQEAEQYANHGIESMVFIEAIDEVYQDLVRHVAKYPDAIAINACISDTDGQPVVFKIANNQGQSSSFLDFGTHSTIHPETRFIKARKMFTHRIDTLVTATGLDMARYDLLNIDLQGAELFALKGMGALLNGFNAAILEINKQETYKGCALVGEIDEYMGQYGFERVETGFWIEDTWTDGFYIKK